MRLPCCDGGVVAGRFDGGRDAEKSSRRGDALLCGVVQSRVFVGRKGANSSLEKEDGGSSSVGDRY